jgi:hypothetical protein
MRQTLCAGVADENGVQMQPGLRLSTVVSVPSLNIPAATITVLVANGNGVVQPNITMQVRSLQTNQVQPWSLALWLMLGIIFDKMLSTPPTIQKPFAW